MSDPWGIIRASLAILARIDALLAAAEAAAWMRVCEVCGQRGAMNYHGDHYDPCAETMLCDGCKGRVQ